MKNLKKLCVAGIALVAMSTMVALGGCGVSGEKYTFEAEEAELGGAAQIEEGKHFWTGDLSAPGDELTQVGYFTSEGATLTFTVNAEADAKVELNFRLASGAMDQSGLWTGGDFIVKSIDFSTQKVFTLTVNDKEVEVKGKLPEITITGETLAALSAENPMALMAVYDNPLCNYQDVKVVVDLKAGENKIVLAATGYTETPDGEGAQPISYGVNIDKLIITSPTKLS